MTTPTIDLTVSPLLDVRTDLAAAIEAATGYTAHPSYLEGFATPCIVLVGNGWQGTASGRVGYRVTVNCVVGNSAGDLNDTVEELARLTANACIDAGWAVPEVPPPGVFTVNERSYAGVAFEASALVTIRSI